MPFTLLLMYRLSHTLLDALALDRILRIRSPLLLKSEALGEILAADETLSWQDNPPSDIWDKALDAQP